MLKLRSVAAVTALRAHLMLRFVQDEPARLPALQQRATFIQDPLVRPENEIALMFLCKYLSFIAVK